MAQPNAQIAAMFEISQLISASRHDEARVFQSILENAKSLCRAQMAGLILATAKDDVQTLAAHIDVAPELVEMFDAGQMTMDPNLSYATRCILDARPIVWADMGESDLYHAASPVVCSMVDDSGMRSVLFVPLLRDEEAIGVIMLLRAQSAPFEQGEIMLVEAFAAQAVIALENVRQFRALQSQLAREAATDEILSVISTSRDDDAQVFATVLEQAAQVCGADQAALLLATPAGTHCRLMASWATCAQRSSWATSSLWRASCRPRLRSGPVRWCMSRTWRGRGNIWNGTPSPSRWSRPKASVHGLPCQYFKMANPSGRLPSAAARRAPFYPRIFNCSNASRGTP